MLKNANKIFLGCLALCMLQMSSCLKQKTPKSINVQNSISMFELLTQYQNKLSDQTLLKPVLDLKAVSNKIRLGAFSEASWILSNLANQSDDAYIRFFKAYYFALLECKTNNIESALETFEFAQSVNIEDSRALALNAYAKKTCQNDALDDFANILY